MLVGWLPRLVTLGFWAGVSVGEDREIFGRVDWGLALVILHLGGALRCAPGRLRGENHKPDLSIFSSEASFYVMEQSVMT